MHNGIRPAIRSLKRAMLGDGSVNLLGKEYRVAYEARGSWVENDYPLLRELARNKSCILDVGANRGLTALLMADALSNGIVYAFEPSQQACATISRNAALNGLADKIAVIDSLVAERSGTILTFYSGSCSVYASIFNSDANQHRESLLKTTVALDDFVRYTSITPDFIKIDVEGAEERVIRGMEETFIRSRPLVFIEIHSLSNLSAAENAMVILQHLQSVRYRMVRLQTKKYVVSITDFDGVRGRSFVLLLPEEMAFPRWLLTFDTSAL